MVFLDFISYHWIRIVCVTQEYQRFLPKAVSVFAGRRCMSVMLFDRTTNKLCLCLSATRRYFAARTKRVFYSLYIQGEMQMETIFILQNDAKYPWFRYRNSCNLITMNESYPENGITRCLNILIQKQQGMKTLDGQNVIKSFLIFCSLYLYKKEMNVGVQSVHWSVSVIIMIIVTFIPKDLIRIFH